MLFHKTQITNKQTTTKYTILSFIPKSIYLQFTNVANIYFLLLVILQIAFKNDLSIASPLISAVPLVVVIALVMVKDAIEDYSRRVMDYRANNLEANVFKSSWSLVKWHLLKHMQIVLLNNNDLIPADIVILATSKDSLCYIETKNLDGETNLKVRRAAVFNQGDIKDDWSKWSGFVEGVVDARLAEWEGVLNVGILN